MVQYYVQTVHSYHAAVTTVLVIRTMTMKQAASGWLPLGASRRLDLDLRALAAFRCLLGLFLLIDTVWGRLSLGQPSYYYDMAWYTSEPASESFLRPADTPHRSPLHQLWFYRGSAGQQYALAALTASVTVAFALGWHGRRGILKVVLWVLITAQQSRNMYVHDGSDTFARHLLFWSCFLPLSDCWSLDAALSTRTRSMKIKMDDVKEELTYSNTSNTAETVLVSTFAAWALVTQIALMYLGTVFRRTLDEYSWDELFKGRNSRAQWINLTAVHYSIAGSFATREHWINHMIRTTPWLSYSMTATAMLGEGLAAPLCLILPVRHRHWCALVLAGLHFGLLLSLRLPHWQCLAMLTQVLCVPSHVWDWLDGSANMTTTATATQDHYKKTDGDPILSNTDLSDPGHGRSLARRRRQQQTTSPIWSRVVQWVALAYALYNFAGERQWIRKHDNGDIGEALRLSQYWIMYASVAKSAHTTLLTGMLQSEDAVDDDDDDDADNDHQRRSIDLLEYIRTGQVQPALSVDVVPLDMSRRYPSARWERAIHTWASQSYLDPKFGRDRGEQLCRALCVLVLRDDRAKPWNRQLQTIELRFQHSYVLPPGSTARYAPRRMVSDTVVTVPCDAPSIASPSAVGGIAA